MKGIPWSLILLTCLLANAGASTLAPDAAPPGNPNNLWEVKFYRSNNNPIYGGTHPTGSLALFGGALYTTVEGVLTANEWGQAEDATGSISNNGIYEFKVANPNPAWTYSWTLTATGDGGGQVSVKAVSHSSSEARDAHKLVIGGDAYIYLDREVEKLLTLGSDPPATDSDPWTGSAWSALSGTGTYCYATSASNVSTARVDVQTLTPGGSWPSGAEVKAESNGELFGSLVFTGKVDVDGDGVPEWIVIYSLTPETASEGTPAEREAPVPSAGPGASEEETPWRTSQSQTPFPREEPQDDPPEWGGDNDDPTPP